MIAKADTNLVLATYKAIEQADLHLQQNSWFVREDGMAILVMDTRGSTITVFEQGNGDEDSTYVFFRGSFRAGEGPMPHTENVDMSIGEW